MKRFILSIFFALVASCGFAQVYPYQPRMRVIIDNDFAGDPDGLVALAHHLLSPSVDVRGVVSSYFPTDGMPGVEIANGTVDGADKVRRLYEVMGDIKLPDVFLGGEKRFALNVSC